jgi:ribonucleoside-diphosphate reductase alpha chain
MRRATSRGFTGNATTDAGRQISKPLRFDDDHFDNALSALVWRRKYRYAGGRTSGPETSITDTWQRVAHAAASIEASDPSRLQQAFLELLESFRFLPGGRILASAGTELDATLFNCFVIGSIDDSMAGIFQRLKESALTMQRGGGIGCDFSTLRPRGTAAASSGRTASGPVSFMHLWNAMCNTLLSQGNRRGAMMGVLRCDHPDILEFVNAKRGAGALTNFNLSALITNAFVEALARDAEWPLVFPAAESGAFHSTIAARELWQAIGDAAYATAEPGVLFVDRVNEFNNLYYREHITTTNPCGEVPLPPNGACNLGSINLAAHVLAPFTAEARLDLDAIGRIARDATRFLDNVIDLSTFPIEVQAAEARATRRIGLGVTGLADALIMLGIRYDSDEGRDTARAVLTRMRDEACAASIALARERGAFPAFEREAYLAGRYIDSLPDRLRDAIAEHGIRNSHLLAIAPAGSISILANNVSSGIEPVFAPVMSRTVLDQAQQPVQHEAVDHAYAVWRESFGQDGSLPPAFVTALELSPDDHLQMAAALQPLVDNSIAKTVNVAEDTSGERCGKIYLRAFGLGLKGCTVFRSGAGRGTVLATTGEPDQALRACPSEVAVC